jgi:hypothetical protein
MMWESILRCLFHVGYISLLDKFEHSVIRKVT